MREGGRGGGEDRFNTILTWRFDLPPNGTQSLRWKARVRPTTSAGSMVRNQVSIRAYGKPWIADYGTGDSQLPVVFTHQAMVVLRTTYFSYNSFAAAAELSRGDAWFLHDILSPEPQHQFPAMEARIHGGAGVASVGGKSATINTLVAECNGMVKPTGEASASRAAGSRKPAIYWPAIWDKVEIPYEFVFLYKITTNSPFLWMTMSEISDPQDACTYVPSTSLSYRGFMHYTVCRVSEGAFDHAGASGIVWWSSIRTWISIIRTSPICPPMFTFSSGTGATRWGGTI